jgi:sodium-dependent dicarboxylate transporter 2/3/5
MESPGQNKNQNINNRKPVYFFIGSFVIAFLLTWFVKEPTFSDSQVYVLFLLFFAIGLWVTEAIPPFAVGLFILAYLVFALGNKYFNSAPEPIDRYVNTFSSSVIWLLLGGFFLAAAMTKTKLNETLMKMTLRVSGHNPRNILICVMITAMLISSVMSNSATAAMLLAAILPLLKSLGKSNLSKALLLGIAVAATTGGMATIIGNSPNVLSAGMLEKNGIVINFLDWMAYGAPISLLLTFLTGWVIYRQFIKNAPAVSFEFMKNESTEISPELKRSRPIVVVVILVTVIFWLTTSIHGISAAAISAIPLVVLTLTGVLTSADIKGLPWDTLLLVAGGLSLGVALEYTGVMEHYALKIKTLEASPMIFFLIMAYTTMILTSIMSDAATSTIFIPMGMALLPEYKEQIAIIIGLSASTAIFLPVSTVCNSIVFSTGYLEQKDFRIVGLIMGILGPFLATMWVLSLK